MVAWKAGASTVFTGLLTVRSWPRGTELSLRAVAAAGDRTITLTRVSGDAAKVWERRTRASGRSLSLTP